MAGSASDYHRGDQDITEQRKTFHTIMMVTKWSCLVLAAALALLIIWFCTPAGFFSGLVTAVIVLIIGIAVLRERGAAAH